MPDKPDVRYGVKDYALIVLVGLCSGMAGYIANDYVEWKFEPVIPLAVASDFSGPMTKEQMQ